MPTLQSPPSTDPVAPLPALVIEPAARGQWRLASQRAVAVGEVLSPLRVSQRFGAPGRYTLQISEHDHATLDPPQLAWVDHSCAPNALFDLDSGALVAIAPLAAGDAVTAFYPATEWALAEPFACRCGAADCLGSVRGARDLPPAALRGRRLSRHVQRLLLRNGMGHAA